VQYAGHVQVLDVDHPVLANQPKLRTSLDAATTKLAAVDRQARTDLSMPTVRARHD
jgi:hypothetical protein